MSAIYKTIGLLYPKFVRRQLKELLNYSSIKIDSSVFNGFVLSFSLLFAIAIGLNLGAFYGHFWIITIASFIVLQIGVYLWLLVAADAKGKFVESVLPDALQLMSSNLRAGLTPDKALLLAARPEFGPLRDEINYIGKEVATGTDLGEALRGICKRVKSKNLERTIELIVSGINSGGELAYLLSETASDLRNQSLVDKKVRSSVNMYVIFIFVAAGIASPILFGLSSYLVEVLTSTIAGIVIPTEAVTMNLPVNFGQVSISVNFVINFSLLFLVVTSIFGSFTIGLIKQGKEKEGAKYIPLLVVMSLILFFVARYLMDSMLGHLFVV